MRARIWTMSDIHLETHRSRWSLARPDGFDILAVAGDVHRADPGKAVDWVADIAAGRPSVMVLGNHEHWHLGLDDAGAIARARAAERGVVLLDGQGWVEVGGVNFAGCTLWTDQALNQPFGSPLYRGEFGEAILDRRAGPRVSGERMRERHRAEAEALAGALYDGALPPGPRVAMTHHSPTPHSIDPAWRHHPTAAMAASDLDHLVASDACDLWIHGHLHHSLDYVPFGRTRVVCNPLGYQGGNLAFDEGLVIEV